jgi:hypothetical protein
MVVAGRRQLLASQRLKNGSWACGLAAGCYAQSVGSANVWVKLVFIGEVRQLA